MGNPLDWDKAKQPSTPFFAPRPEESWSVPEIKKSRSNGSRGHVLDSNIIGARRGGQSGLDQDISKSRSRGSLGPSASPEGRSPPHCRSPISSTSAGSDRGDLLTRHPLGKRALARCSGCGAVREISLVAGVPSCGCHVRATPAADNAAQAPSPQPRTSSG